MTEVYDLKTDYSTNPINVDNVTPYFSWKYRVTNNNVKVTHFQILVATSAINLEREKFDLWDSGRVKIGKSPMVQYSGAPLKSRDAAFWIVRIWDENENVSTVSKSANFEIALISDTDWHAYWIGFPAGRPGRALYFRNEYLIKKPIKKSRAYVSSLGWNEFYVNGEKVGASVLNPAQTEFSKRVLYSTYDLNPFLKIGQNVLGAIVAGGWYGTPKFLAQIELEFQDGSKDRFLTAGRNENDKNLWKLSDGPIIETSIFDGEVYDANREIDNWMSASREGHSLIYDGSFYVSMVVSPPGGALVSQVVEPIEVVGEIKPKEITEPKLGIFVIDNGQNLAGWLKIKLDMEKNQKLIMRFGENLYPNGRVNQENLRFAAAQDTYISKLDGVITWEPKFTYHGFRYVEIEGLEKRPSPEDFNTQIVRSNVAKTGTFQCANTIVNQIQAAVEWTEISNLHGLPTDCPQRAERLGWLNDMTARCEELIFNFDMSKFLPKWLEDIRDSQDQLSGAIPDTAPYNFGAMPGDPVCISNVLIAWLLYKHFGDKKTLEKNFDSMSRWAQYLSSRANDGILDDSYIGDWAPPLNEAIPGSIGTSSVSANTPGGLVSTAHFIHMLSILSKIASVLNNEHASKELFSECLMCKKAFHQKFFNSNTGGYGSNNQACNSMALYMDIVPADLRSRVLENLVSDVVSNEYHLTTGNLATKYIFDVLAEGGETDIAFKLLTQTSYPSWGYMLAKGATTMWERWEEATGNGMNSHNHAMYASIGSWFYKYLAGIKLPDSSIGFSDVIIEPVFPKDLDWVKVELDTIKGKISVSWVKQSTSILLKIKLPLGCKCDLKLPLFDRNFNEVKESNVTLEKSLNSRIKSVIQDNNRLIINIEGGNYDFEFKHN